jgi:nucleotide-binding universal stress UspA family protein
MKNFFNRILVPVLLNKDSAPIIEKAIDIANEFGCDIHLLHVHTTSKAFSFLQDRSFTTTKVKEQLQAKQVQIDGLIDNLRLSLDDGLLASGSVVQGSWQSVLKHTIITHDIDLVIIPSHSGRVSDPVIRQIDVNRLSQQTQCPVLTITSGFEIGHIQNIVVPVNDFLPVRKLTAATFLSKKYNGMVHLLGQRSESYSEDKTNTVCLAKAYQLLSEYTNVRVHCSSDKGSSVASGALEYARKVDADLIVVNPGKESKLNGMFSRWMSKYLHRESNIPVLTISPQQ